MPSQLTIDRTKLFIKRYGMDIARAIEDSGLFFEAVIGQKCNESAYGDSNLAKNYNNFGGIRGNVQEAYGTTERGWAKFRTPEDCFRSYVRVVTSLPRYIQGGVLTATSPEEQIIRMVKAGYCKIPDGNVRTANDYLKICQGAIDSTRIICPLGKITDVNKAIAQLQTRV